MTSTIPNEVAGPIGDESVGAALTASDLARERDEAHRFHDARLRREMDEMRARLD